MQSTVSGSGNLANTGQLNVNFKTSGTIQAIYVKQGQHVYDGQLIASLDPSAAEAGLAQAQASLQQAQASLEQAEANGSSSKPSSGSTGGGSNQSSESADVRAANIAAAQANLNSAELNVQSAQTNVYNTNLYSPGVGTVAAVSVSVGDSVSPGGSSGSAGSSGSQSSSRGGGGASSAGSGAAAASTSSSAGSSAASSPFVVLTNLRAMQLVVPLSESDAIHVKANQPANITVNALPNTQLAAHVTNVSLLSTTNNGVVSYDVTLQLDQSEHGLRPGMSASAQIVVSQVQDAVNLPSSAVNGSGRNASVELVTGGKQTRTPVVTGMVGDSSTQIITGVEAGAQVALPSVSRAATGTAIGGGGTAGALGGGFGPPGGFGGGGFRRGGG